MSQKYYYMRLRDNFFDRDEIKIIESQENGYIYSNILLKIYLRSLRFSGVLQVAERIPYDIKTLSKVIGHDVDHVHKAISMANEFRLLEIQDGGLIYVHDLQNFIGRSTDEADRIRLFREKSDKTKALSDDSTNVRQMSSILEIEREIDIEKDIKKERKKNISANAEPNGEPKIITDDILLWQDFYRRHNERGTLPIDAKGKAMFYSSAKKHCIEILKSVSLADALEVVAWAFRDPWWSSQNPMPFHFPKMRAGFETSKVTSKRHGRPDAVGIAERVAQKLRSEANAKG